MTIADPGRTGRKTAAAPSPIAHKIADLVRAGPFGHTKLYSLIREGVLPAYQVGGSSIVLDEDWQALFRHAPPLVSKRAVRTRPVRHADEEAA
ncbi:hypothetical protein LMIY3S_02718 [Labrys miyagiensis]